MLYVFFPGARYRRRIERVRLFILVAFGIDDRRTTRRNLLIVSVQYVSFHVSLITHPIELDRFNGTHLWIMRMEP